jgi:cell division protein FtsQ
MMRMRANRRKVKADRRAWSIPTITINWRAVLLPPAIVAFSFVALAGVKFLLDQPVRSLEIDGTFQRVTPIQVEAAVAGELDVGFLSLDLEAVRDRVRSLDWIDKVQVRRAWPGTVVVSVTEHQAAARWGDNGLLNTRGELFTDNAQFEFPELPHLAGPPGSEQEVARRYLAVRGLLVQAELTLTSLTMDERGAWRVVLGGGQEILLGRRDVDERLYKFFEVVAPALVSDFARVQYIDLRYTNGFAVGWVNRVDGDLVVRAEVPGRG